MTRTGRVTLAARKAKRRQYIDQAIAEARLAGRSMTCTHQPVEFHDTCAGLAAAGDLGCLCECHDGDVAAKS